MEESLFSSLSAPAAVFTIVVGWLTLVRWTRDSRDFYKNELRQQFWIEHSVDLQYAIGETASPDTTDKLLIIRGLEIGEYGWWFRIGKSGDPYILAEPDEAYRMFRNRMSFLAKKVQYYIYRNLVPFASLRMECMLLIEAQNCRISMMKNTEYDENGRLEFSSGPMITDEIDYLTGCSPLWDGLYKLTIDTYDYNEADETLQQLRVSTFVDDIVADRD